MSSQPPMGGHLIYQDFTEIQNGLIGSISNSLNGSMSNYVWAQKLKEKPKLWRGCYRTSGLWFIYGLQSFNVIQRHITDRPVKQFQIASCCRLPMG